MAIWHIGRLHAQCSRLLDGKDPAAAQRHQWSDLAFRAEPDEPFRRGGEGLVVKNRSHQGNPFDYWKQFPPEAFAYFAEQAGATSEPIVKAQYLSCLWESRGLWKTQEPRVPMSIPEIARGLVAACASIIEREIENEEDEKGAGRQVTIYFGVAIFIASRFGDYSGLVPLLPRILTYAEKLIPGGACHWSLAIADVLTYLAQPYGKGRNSLTVSDADLSRLQNVVEQVQHRYDTEPGHGAPDEALDILARIEGVQGKKVTNEDYERRLAEGYMKRAELPWPSFMKASFLKDAAAHYIAAGMKEAAGKAKLMSRQAVQAAQDNNEFKTISVSRTITQERMEQIIDPYFKEAKGGYEVLLRTCQRLFAISIETGRVQEPQSALYYLIPVVPIVDDRVKAIEGSGDGVNEYQIKQDWVKEIQIESKLPLTVIFEKLRNDTGLTHEDLYSVLSASEVWRDQDLPFLHSAVKRFLARDYISCIHILVPRIEQLIRLLLMAVGADVTAYKDGDLRERPLGELLREAEEKGYLPVTLVHLLQAVLSEEWGLNLRNRVAHGLISEGECTNAMANRVVHTAMVLSTLTFQTQEEAAALKSGELPSPPVGSGDGK